MEGGRSSSMEEGNYSMDHSYARSNLGQGEADGGQQLRAASATAGVDEPQSATTVKPEASSSVLGALFSTSPSDDHPSSSSTSSSPQSCSFSSTTGIDPSESAASSANSDGEWDEENCRTIPSSFSTATLRAVLEGSDQHPHKSSSLPLSHPLSNRPRRDQAASEPVPSTSYHQARLNQYEEEATPVPSSEDRHAFNFPLLLPTQDSRASSCSASGDPYSATSSALFNQLASPPALTLDTRLPTISSTSPSASPSVPTDSTSELPSLLSKRSARPLSPSQLADRLEHGGTLVVDVRSLSAFLGHEQRLRGSINVNFPTLLIKRFRKGNSASFNLSSFVTTEAGKSLYQAAAQRRGTDIIVVDDRVETRDPHSLNPGSVLLSVLERRDDSGGVFYLDRPMREAVDVDVRLRRWMVEGEGEYELSGSSATNSEDDEFDARSSNGFQQRGLQPIDLTGSPGSQPRLSPLPRTPTHANSFGSPSSTPPKTPGGTSRPRPPRLKRIDTSENLLGSRKNSASSAVGRTASRSPSAPALRVDASCANNRGAAPTSSMSLQSICHMQAKSPAATATRFAEADLTLPSTSSSSSHPASSSNPSSPEDEPRTSVADVPRFIVSTIIPGFLYLGPEPTSSKDLDELERLGVKEVLNLALECEDKDGEVGRRFELRKIGMRDFVEETGVQQAIEEACRILGDAQLQSKPVYCHCRAGKSRSVTIVLAYLVHRNHWPLKRAYAHVSERRKGISPNIGFVAELMTWEERERGRKSSGVFGTSHSIPSSSSSASSTSASASAYAYPSSALSANLNPPAAGANPSAPTPPSMARSSSDQGQLPTVPSMMHRPSHLRKESLGGGGEGERRAPDGTWMARAREEFDERGNAQRRSSRAGLESFAPTRVGD